MYLSLNQAKNHLNIDQNFSYDDNYITSLINVAEAAVENHIGRKLSYLEDENSYLPKPLTHAMLLLVGQYYATREAITFGTPHELPMGYDYLLQPYENYTYWG